MTDDPGRRPVRPSIGTAVIVLAVSAAIAAYVPALRASNVAPLTAIRAN